MHLRLNVRFTNGSVCWYFILLLLRSGWLSIVATRALMLDATDICAGSFFLNHIRLEQPLSCRLLLHIPQCILKLQRENTPEDRWSLHTCSGCLWTYLRNRISLVQVRRIKLLMRICQSMSKILTRIRRRNNSCCFEWSERILVLSWRNLCRRRSCCCCTNSNVRQPIQTFSNCSSVRSKIIDKGFIALGSNRQFS